MIVRPTDFSEAEVEALVLYHLARMHETSPADAVFALGLDALRAPEISGFAAWDDSTLLGVGALKSCGEYGEIKSMRTGPQAAGRGVGSKILAAIMQKAGELGFSDVFLETGPPPHFAAANRFYEKHGFAVCGPFGDYVQNEHSVFYKKRL